MKEPINIGAIDPQQRLDVARGQLDITDDVILTIIRKSLDDADGGYICDTQPDKAVQAGRAVLSLVQQPAPSVAGMDGWRWVPAVATLQMKNAGWQEIERQGINPEDCEMQTIYCALLSAAPVPPGQGEPVGEPVGEVVVTRNEAGQIIAVTRQDQDGRILSVIAESTPQPPAQVDEREERQMVPEGYRLIRIEHFEFIKSAINPKQVDAYRGRNVYDDDKVFANWRACDQALDEVRDACQQVEWDAENELAELLASPAPSADGGKVESDEVRRLGEALEDGRRAMFAVLNQETKLKAVAKRVLDAEIKRIDAALSAQQGEGERG